MSSSFSKQIQSYLLQSAKLIEDCLVLENEILEIAQLLIEAFEQGNKVLVAGNGGSCADAQHIAGELVSKYQKSRKGLPVMSLPTNLPVLTAISNDFDFKKVIAREIDAFGKKGDIFWAISTSGNSQNLLEAIKIAKHKGIKIVGFSGKTGGEMEKSCDIILNIPHKDTPMIQQCHITLAHLICDLIEQQLPEREFLPKNS